MEPSHWSIDRVRWDSDAILSAISRFNGCSSRSQEGIPRACPQLSLYGYEFYDLRSPQLNFIDFSTVSPERASIGTSHRLGLLIAKAFPFFLFLFLNFFFFFLLSFSTLVNWTRVVRNGKDARVLWRKNQAIGNQVLWPGKLKFSPGKRNQ